MPGVPDQPLLAAPSSPIMKPGRGWLSGPDLGHKASVVLSLRALDPGEQDGAPAAPFERLEAMGHRAEKDEIVRGAAAPHAKPARCPDVIELKLTEAVVGDPKASEDADAVACPDVRPHGRRDRILSPTISHGSSSRLVSAQHRSALR
jgi:hypothetical protein